MAGLDTHTEIRLAPALRQWFAQRGWQPFPFQRDAWQAYAAGCSGLINAPTGLGKTLAAWLGPVSDWLERDRQPPPTGSGPHAGVPLQVLWLTPLRALVNDTCLSLQAPIDASDLPWTIEKRTGDVSQSVRQRQRRRLPSCLVTTPESLSVLLSYADAAEKFASLRCVIVDEWHELLGNKRGVQAELCLARLRRWQPELRVWGLSATLGNLDEAMRVLIGASHRANQEAEQEANHGAEQAVMIRAAEPKPVEIRTLIPQTIDRFPWYGHLGTKQLEPVVQAIDEAKTTLIFTNTRSQCEIWYQALLQARSDWLGDPEHRIAIHHGSLERDLRLQVEAMLDAGELRAVVCTSSLDLGVDFPAVDQVIQLGSPKGVARLMQRAGRSGHQPGAISRVWCVPTYAFELVEFAAAREAAQGGRLESRPPLRLTLDVLAQHLVTVALGGGFHEAQMRKEVRQSHAFAELTDEQWGWVMDFITRGGPSLTAYPQFAKVERDDSGFCRGPSQKIARMHRLAIGTITSDSVLKVKFVGGKQLGTIEENFISKVHPGDRFVFAGRTLELVRVREMTAQVRSVRGKRAAVPRWYGGRFPLSTRLAEAVRQKLQAAGEGIFDSPEMQRMAPLVELQRRWSRLPRADELMIETTRTRDGHHHFLYPFEGRLVHEGLGSVLAHRLTKQQPRSVELTVTDYGIELLTAEPLDFDEAQWRALLSPQGLTDDLVACLNAGELTKRQFRDIARIAGLITPGYPGLASKSNRQLQASAELFYDVFLEFDPDNLLMEQARREVLEEQLESRRIRAALDRLGETNLLLQPTPRLTPLAFPIWAERLRTQTMSSESWTAKVTRMVEQLEAAADAG